MIVLTENVDALHYFVNIMLKMRLQVYSLPFTVDIRFLCKYDERYNVCIKR